MGFFVFGQLSSLCEIMIVLWFLIKFFKWKDEIICRKAVVAGVGLLLLLAAQMNGRFDSSYIVVIVVDVSILVGFCRIALKGALPIQILGCITPFLIVTIGNILIMQVMALYRRIDVQGYMDSQGISFAMGVILSKLLLGASLYWLQKKFSFQSISLSPKYYRIINAVCIYMVIMEILLYYVANMGVYHKRANVWKLCSKSSGRTGRCLPNIRRKFKRSN